MAEAPSYERKIEIEFDAFVNRSLDREIKKHIRDTGRRMKNQILFCEMDEWIPEGFEDADASKAFAEIEAKFKVLEYSVSVHNDLLYDALSRLEQKYRELLLMEFWLNMTDREISDETGINRRTVNDMKKRGYTKLKNILEADGYDANDFFS